MDNTPICHMTTSLSSRIIAHAISLGFDHAAILPAPSLPTRGAYLEWIAEGRHGEMSYLDRHQDLRFDAAMLEPGTRSVIALLIRYHQPLDLLPGGLRIARYAHGDDYHDSLRDRMRQLAAFIHAETGAPVAARPAVDSAPLLERDLAKLAGLGWIGKNTLLIHPRHGSFTFLAELLVDCDLTREAPETPHPDRCGTCSRCIDACPTQAIAAPYLLDARRCISYLTIELRGPIPRHLRAAIGDHLFGCDICQDVCPWNRRVSPTQDPAFQPRQAVAALSPITLLCMDQDTFSRTFSGSAIKRTKRRGLLRNAAVVLGNTRPPGALDALIARLTDEPEPLVRGHIAWALHQYDEPAARQAIQRAISVEQDAYVLDELAWR
jgi:epoxyqueuosine reductase